jgi:hypothetical protein
LPFCRLPFCLITFCCTSPSLRHKLASNPLILLAHHINLMWISAPNVAAARIYIDQTMHHAEFRLSMLFGRGMVRTFRCTPVSRKVITYTPPSLHLRSRSSRILLVSL